MAEIMKVTLIAGLAALGAMASVPAAQADTIYLELDQAEVQYEHRGWNRDRDRDEDRRWNRDDDRDYGRRGRVCTPERALNRAERLGFRRVELERVGRNRIVVSGRRRGERLDIVFSREGRDCPVIDIR